MQDFDSHHLQDTINKLSGDEKNLLRLIVGLDDDVTAGGLYNLLKGETSPERKDSDSQRNSISYASFDRALKKLEFVRLIDTKFTGKGVRGNSRLIILRFDSEEIGKVLD